MIFFFQILFVSSAFHDPFAAGFPVLQNQGWIHLLNKSLQRLPPYAESRVRSAVWQSSLCPTGIAMHFRSNATSFAIVGTLVGQIVYPNIPQTGAAGVELYARHTDGKWYSCFDRCYYGAEVKCNYENLLPATREYRMYVSSLVQVKDFKFAASGTNYFLE
ncbi:hypothetical protein TRFO_41043 [Tritrichomonas foetus]|uniref:SGNH hydrolase-type esterase N-terminal domain-containing protein n=1 Tax=Tritrichomonas foetus TaxID=1144522 RepID=A0A1J4L1S3_9EUKA|nr:hypothetical protein TRFO_41043 [Tritrichomonas foetus]|eukprot:OHT17387.1 hypothetical protein TRFO_41043 [Tritrichomonas foetus]